jgi:thiol-disulfide isomerase/thioredoxin
MKTVIALIVLFTVPLIGQFSSKRTPLELLDRLDSLFRVARSLHYKSNYFASDPTEDSTFHCQAEVWLQILQSDSVFHCRFHARGLDSHGPFDYFYDGQNALEFRHSPRTVLIFNLHLYPADSHNPAKARTALSPFVALFVEPHLKDLLLKENPHLTIHAQRPSKIAELSLAYPINSFGQVSTTNLFIDDSTLAITQIEMHLNWRGLDNYYKILIDNFEFNPDLDETQLVPKTDYGSYESKTFSGYESKPIDSSSVSLRGVSAPDFTYPDVGGRPISLRSQKAKFVLIDFWEPWCGSCIFSLPKIKALQERYAHHPFIILGVTTDSPNTVGRLAKLNELNYPNLLADKAIIGHYKISAWPTYVLIKPDGRIAEVSIGDLSRIEKSLESLMK